MKRPPLRFAVVGLGHIAQRAVLPAFAHAHRKAELTALVSGDAQKRRLLGRRFDAAITCDYDAYDGLLRSGAIEAVYIALPNQLHADYARRAMEAGVHVLCEKPLATTVGDARMLARVAKQTQTQLMVAYRLHFDPATLRAIDLARQRRAGELRMFASVFSSPADHGDIRLERAGRGALFDLGIYCVNAARMVFHSEPTEVVAMHGGLGSGRFREVPEMTAALLRYPGDRIAMFTCSLHAFRTGTWTALAEKRRVRMDPAYTYREPLVMQLETGRGVRVRRQGVHDQFAAELEHFVTRVRTRRRAETSVAEGEADVRILDAIDRAARTGRVVRVRGIPRDAAPTRGQGRAYPPVAPLQVKGG